MTPSGRRRSAAATLGWTYSSMPMGEMGDYHVVMLGDTMVGGIMQIGGPDFENVPDNWFSYLEVDDLDKRLALLAAEGGTVRCGRPSTSRASAGSPSSRSPAAPCRTDGPRLSRADARTRSNPRRRARHARDARPGDSRLSRDSDEAGSKPRRADGRTPAPSIWAMAPASELLVPIARQPSSITTVLKPCVRASSAVQLTQKSAARPTT